MADVFLSYRNTPERRALVKRLALLLRAHEITVWWDYGLEAGESYRAQITEELSKARIVAPLWCAESIQSKWVSMEAELGKDKLVPARLQKVVPPEAFEGIHAENLIGWNGAVDHARALSFVRKVCDRLGRAMQAPVDMMEELAQLPPLSPLADIDAIATAHGATRQDAVLSDLRATWRSFPAYEDLQSVERFLARVRASAPGSGLEFEVEHAIDAMRAEAQRLQSAQRAAATAEEHLRKTPGAEFRDAEGLPLMVTIPPGVFLMGSPNDERDRMSREGPLHQVRIEHPIAIGKFPVTVGEFRRFVEATGHDSGGSGLVWTGSEWEEVLGRNWLYPGFPQQDDHPVTCINWYDAVAFVSWMSNETGRSYRLLSEAEWEYACRAGTQTRYAFGDEIGGEEANFSGRFGGTVPVSAYPGNLFRLHGMHGNVWEWCADVWNESYDGAPNDGSPWATGETWKRVLRGGSWGHTAEVLRSALRYGDYPEGRSYDVGFRVARALSR